LLRQALHAKPWSVRSDRATRLGGAISFPPIGLQRQGPSRVPTSSIQLLRQLLLLPSRLARSLPLVSVAQPPSAAASSQRETSPAIRGGQAASWSSTRTRSAPAEPPGLAECRGFLLREAKGVAPPAPCSVAYARLAGFGLRPSSDCPDRCRLVRGQLDEARSPRWTPGGFAERWVGCRS